jgi:DNA polymerase III alpha subunit (gram-positive type)
MVTAGGNIIPDSKYCSLVKPPTPIPRLIANRTSIIYGMVHSQPDFNLIGHEFFEFIKQQITDYEYGREETVKHMVFIAHCGRQFDMPFLMRQCQRCSVRLEQAFLDKLYLLDTWESAKGVSNANPFLPWPPIYKLATLYQHVFGKEIGDDTHRRHVDVEATIVICSFIRLT